MLFETIKHNMNKTIQISKMKEALGIPVITLAGRLAPITPSQAQDSCTCSGVSTIEYHGIPQTPEENERYYAKNAQIRESERTHLRISQSIYRDRMRDINEAYDDSAKLARNLHAAAVTAASAGYLACLASSPRGGLGFADL